MKKIVFLKQFKDEGIRRSFVFAMVLGSLLMFMFSASLYAQVPGLDRGADKMEQAESGFIDAYGPYIIAAGVIIGSIMFIMGTHGVLGQFGRTILGGVILLEAVTIALWIAS